MAGAYTFELGKLHNVSQSGEFMGHHPLYNTWYHMMDRCYNPRNHAFERYGGRGILVCEDWHDFKKFSQDVTARPSPSHTIDRIDNELGYFPGNTRWATDLEQSNNRRTNRTYHHNGIVKTISQIARDVGMWKTTLRDRLDSGMSIEEATRRKVYKNPHRESNSGARNKQWPG